MLFQYVKNIYATEQSSLRSGLVYSAIEIVMKGFPTYIGVGTDE